MTTRPAPPPPSAQARHLADVAAVLAGHRLTIRRTRIGGTPVLTIEDHATGGAPATISVDPDTASPGPSLECTCIWTPAPGTTPGAVAGTILAVLDAIRPGTGDTRR